MKTSQPLLVKRNHGKLLGIFLVVLSLLTALPVLTQQKFDPNRVQPANCRNGRMACGYRPTPRDRMAAIPQSEANTVRHRGLPSSVDLSSRMPPIGNQGEQGSCVGWSSTYAIKSYQEQMKRNWGYDSPWKGGSGAHVFSPAWTYNQINGGEDGGSSPADALTLIVRSGAAPWQTMPYTESDFSRQPGSGAKSAATQYRAQSFQQVDYTNPTAIKNVLAGGNPVLIGILVYQNFYDLGSNVYDQFQGRNVGGHAIAVVGYDDSKTSPKGMRGAFKLFNSWDTDWGNNGYGWVAYDFMATAVDEAYELVPMGGSSPEPQPQPNVNPGPNVPDVPDVIEHPENVNAIEPPKQVSASHGTFPDRVEVRWSEVENASAYEIQRANPGDEDEFESIGNADDLSFSDTAVQPDVSYRYRVIAIGEDAQSSAEDSPVAEGFARAQVQNTAPDRVVGLEAEQQSDGSVELNWTEAAGATSYQVIRYDNARKQWANLSQNNTSTSFTDRSPSANGSNYYRVRAANARGTGAWSEAAEAVAGGADAVPAQVQNLTASEGIYRDKIELTWDRVPSAQKYYVFRYDVEEEEASGPYEVSTNTYTDTSKEIKSGNQFAYLVIAANQAGYGEYCEPVVGYADPNVQRAGQVLPPPRNVQSRIDEAKRTISISWSAVTGAAEYYVFRKKRGQSEFQFVRNVPGNTTTYSEQIPGQPGEVYLYVIKSKSTLGGESGSSDAVAGFVNPARQRVSHRVMASDGLDRFVGTWRATVWDGNSSVQEYVITVQANGANFNASLKIGQGQPRTVTGRYAATSDLLETSGFSMKLAASGKMAVVEITDRQILPQDMRKAFLKD